jgi:hypothetical protein
VIVDTCREHGIWLDGGELRQLLEWTRAGGQIHHEKTRLEQERLSLQQEKEKLRLQSIGTYDSGSTGPGAFANASTGWNGRASSFGEEPDLFDLLSRFARKLFG